MAGRSALQILHFSNISCLQSGKSVKYGKPGKAVKASQKDSGWFPPMKRSLAPVIKSWWHEHMQGTFWCLDYPKDASDDDSVSDVALNCFAGGRGVSELERVLEKVESHCGKGQLLPRYNSFCWIIMMMIIVAQIQQLWLNNNDDDNGRCLRSQEIWGRRWYLENYVVS